jgi:hypothetical protein
MRYNISDIKHILIFIILLGLLTKTGFSQGTDMGRERRPGVFIGISAGPARTQMINESTLDIKDVSSTDKMAFAGSIDLGYYISKYFGIKTGIGYAAYNTKLTLETYLNSLYLRDTENESYQLRVTASGISESQSMKVMTFPLNIVLHIPLSPVVSIYLEPGINLVVPFDYTFSNSGLFTYKGYYPEYNVVFENLPGHGLSTNKTITTDDQLKIKQIWSEIVISSGLNIAVRGNFYIAAGVNYSRSISDISEYESPDTYQLSPLPDQVNSLMGGSSKVTTSLFGVNVTLRYFINR